jgi:hypothetical protein
LQITAGTLTTGTLQAASRVSTRAVSAIWSGRIGRTCSIGARASLCRITYTSACTTHRAHASELTLSCAASFVAGIADCTVIELAGGGVAAGVATAAFITTTVAIFSFLDDTVAALITGDSHNTLVIRKTARLYRVATQGAADVAD